MNEELGIIKNIHVGMRDSYYPICWFIVDTINGSSLQTMNLQDLGKLLKDNSIYKLENLEGRPCVVEIDKSIMKFKRLFK